MLTMKKAFFKAIAFVFILGSVSALVSGCSIFKEDDCECPTFGKKMEGMHEVATNTLEEPA